MNGDFDQSYMIEGADDDQTTNQDLNESRVNRTIIRKRRVVKKVKKKKKVGDRSFIGPGGQTEVAQSLQAV